MTAIFVTAFVTGGVYRHGIVVAKPRESRLAEPACAGCGEMLLPRRGGVAERHATALPAANAPAARLDADPARTSLLALLDRVGGLSLARAVTSGEDARAALAELADVADLVEAARATDLAAAAPSVTAVESR
ncbi:hypothetical protein GCM10027258_47910 [Amycolatopsis stemonae]